MARIALITGLQPTHWKAFGSLDASNKAPVLKGSGVRFQMCMEDGGKARRVSVFHVPVEGSVSPCQGNTGLRLATSPVESNMKLQIPPLIRNIGLALPRVCVVNMW